MLLRFRPLAGVPSRAGRMVMGNSRNPMVNGRASIVAPAPRGGRASMPHSFLQA